MSAKDVTEPARSRTASALRTSRKGARSHTTHFTIHMCAFYADVDNWRLSINVFAMLKYTCACLFRRIVCPPISATSVTVLPGRCCSWSRSEGINSNASHLRKRNLHRVKCEIQSVERLMPSWKIHDGLNGKMCTVNGDEMIGMSIEKRFSLQI